MEYEIIGTHEITGTPEPPTPTNETADYQATSPADTLVDPLISNPLVCLGLVGALAVGSFLHRKIVKSPHPWLKDR